MSTATSKVLALALLLMSAAAAAAGREASTPEECRTAANRPPLSEARKAAAQDSGDVELQFKLADAWSDAGCFTDAVDVLQKAAPAHPDNPALTTRLRVARSLVGEEHFFDDLDRADMEARLKRATFRCNTLADMDACADAVRMRPDDPALLTAEGDALMKANHAREAAEAYRRAGARAPNERDLPTKLAAAESQVAATADRPPPHPAEGSPPRIPSPPMTVARLQPSKPPTPASREAAPPRQYSNADEETQSH